MRKNKMMRAASALLVAVLLTTSTISGTFAKYVTTAEGSDIARVAKWGVTITPNGEVFATEYAKTDDTYTLSDNTVVSSTGDKVVAPGTNGNLKEVQLIGTPEVAVRVTYKATIDLTGWVLADSTEYCPIIFTVEGVTYGTKDTTATNQYNTIALLEEALKNAIENCKKDYEPKTDLSTKADDAPTVSWSWPFYVDDAHDEKDTHLGNVAANNTVLITIETTVTQID